MDPELEAILEEDRLSMKHKGKWALWTRGTNPLPYTPWLEATDGRTDMGELLTDFLDWQRSGQHVRLEWVPESAYGALPNDQ